MLEHCQAPRSSPRRPTSSRSTVPRCRRTSRRLRDVPSSRFTRHRPSGATLQRRFGGSASNAPCEQPTGNLDGRRLKCSTMMAATLHGQNENYPPTHIRKSRRAPSFAQQPLPLKRAPLALRPRAQTPPRRRGAPGGKSRSFPLAISQVRGLDDYTYTSIDWRHGGGGDGRGTRRAGTARRGRGDDRGGQWWWGVTERW